MKQGGLYSKLSSRFDLRCLNQSISNKQRTEIDGQVQSMGIVLPFATVHPEDWHYIACFDRPFSPTMRSLSWRIILDARLYSYTVQKGTTARHPEKCLSKKDIRHAILPNRNTISFNTQLANMGVPDPKIYGNSCQSIPRLLQCQLQTILTEASHSKQKPQDPRERERGNKINKHVPWPTTDTEELLAHRTNLIYLN